MSQTAFITPHPGPAGPPPTADMVWVPGTASLPGFWIDACPVTNEEFASFVADSGYRPEYWAASAVANHITGPVASHPESPVVAVTWADVSQYAQWAGKALPTDAQWQVAAGADPAGAIGPAGVIGPAGAAGAASSTPVGPCPVARHAPNQYGLYDTIGNVWEWTSDWYRPGFKVVRGGTVRPDARAGHPVDQPGDRLGFRCLVRP